MSKQPSLSDLLNKDKAPTPTTPAPEIKEATEEQVLDVTVPIEPGPVKTKGKKESKAEEKPVEETPEETPEITGTTLEDALSKPKEEKSSDGSFWDDVDKLRGERIEVDYEGVDPESPEGAYKREQAIEERAFASYEDYLAKNFPKEYQALVLRMQGQDPSVIYKDSSYDFTRIELKEDDENTQKDVIRQDMKAQGIPEKRIEAMVKMIYDSGDLFTEAQDSLNRLKEKQVKDLADQTKQIEESRKQKEQEINTFGSVVDKVVTTGQVGDFIIPEKDKKGFYEFLATNIKYEDGSFYAVVPLDKDPNKLNKQLQTEFFRYKQGNLKDIVYKQAITENAKRLKKNIKESIEPGGEAKKSTQNKTWQELAGLK